MFIYTLFATFAGVLAGILISICSKKAENVIYGTLDKIGRITNVVLIPVYACVAPVCIIVGMLCEPNYEGILGIVGWIVSLIIGSATLICGLGLGFSVALRKKGKRKLSFAVQFAGVVGIALSFVMFAVFYGNLLTSLN